MCFSFQPTDRVFANTLHVFALSDAGAFAILQSRIHEAWARHRSSSLKNDLRYSLTKAFFTFPFPNVDPLAPMPEAAATGESLHTARAKLMIDLKQGLTKTYNAVLDPESDDERILELRSLHEATDRAVLDSYGWSDIEVPPYCPVTGEEEATVEEFKDEIVDRLYALNAERSAQEEQRKGLGKEFAEERVSKKSTSAKSKKKVGDTMSLPGMSDAEGES